MTRRSLFAAVLAVCVTPLSPAADPWITFKGGDGPGKGKKIVLVSGDEEYRSEEALPQLAKILATHHGFDCTVLFAVDPKDGTVNPNVTTNIPGLETLADADLMVIFTRFRDLPDDQMKHIADYLEAGKPVVGMRTSTHAFDLKSPTYKKYTFRGVEGYKGGFGKQILGETWVNHHGGHGREGTRGVPAPGQADSPILKGIAPGSIFGTSDVYTVNLPLPGDSQPLVLGEVTQTLEPDSQAVEGKKNDPMMPVAWTKTYTSDAGKIGRVFTTTMGASKDLEFEGTRRLLVNGCYWALGLEDQIPAKSDVSYVGEYKPTNFKFGGFVTGTKPEDWVK